MGFKIQTIYYIGHAYSFIRNRQRQVFPIFLMRFYGAFKCVIDFSINRLFDDYRFFSRPKG